MCIYICFLVVVNRIFLFYLGISCFFNEFDENFCKFLKLYSDEKYCKVVSNLI